MTFDVPAVDISPYVHPDAYGDADRAAVATAMDAVCATVGFVQVLGHGVPDEVIAGLAAASDAFFTLDADAKQAYQLPPSINRGYTPPKSESLSLSLGVESATKMNDFFEAFNVGTAASEFPGLGLPESDYSENVWPVEAASFRPGVEAYYREAGRVAHVLTRVFADALELAPDFFEQFTDHSLDVMRMNNYALPPGEIVLDGDLTGMGEHTDYGIVTVLWADQVAGLQVLGPDQVWHDVSPADGALLVNLGDLTAQWTNDRWRSTLHRVKPPIVGGTIRRRRSAAYFHDGNVDALIETIPTCVDDDHPAGYAPVTVGEHINAKLRGSRAGVLYTDSDRNAERVRSAAP
ncbi:isopenicillin N synthase family dioxygenase [Cryptosporangium phraense]|uniref:Isopenicillin N synthase family oxygenase n=1 Tax=Cryptosporangium phraense TaxID=2593070 RepID=A0A545AII0_9ACTN|nr:2-oxoglutarate and iron-dependent oxygenase domain-containing protein [Cryptosporangium phraense]TQS41121.1 isopenicillin N synthase family oxygenase [Cryptosporangium phraense]